MARKDVVKYYLDQEQVYMELLKDLKDLKKDKDGGLIKQEEYDIIEERLLNEIQLIKDNYNQLSYIMMLLNEPHRNEKKRKYRKDNKELYEYCKKEKCTQEDLYYQSTDALKNFRDMVKGLK